MFYRALIEGGLTAPVDRLAEALAGRGLVPFPIFITSLKDAQSIKFLKSTLERRPPAVILNATAFAAGRFDGEDDGNPVADFDCPVLQVIFSGSSAAAWATSSQGLSPRDLAMNVVLPELDGRIITSAASFKEAGDWHAETECSIMSYRPQQSRIDRIADLAAAWVKLRLLDAAERRVAIVLANYPNRDGRIANGVGYDTPASTVAILDALAAAGYRVDAPPRHGNDVIAELMRGPTNSGANPDAPTDALLPLATYRSFFDRLPSAAREALLARWGAVEQDPFCRQGVFRLPVRLHGHVAIAIQPARGYNIDPKSTYHDAALVPPHGYLAFYVWLREVFGAHAVIHNGKHGNLEWLPGKATALSDECWPDIALGPLPQLYPFIVNDPGEGTQAKRRTAAVIIDHLTPPLARAESYGPLLQLEALIDEYALAAGIDARRQKLLRRRIAELVQSSGIDRDAAICDVIADDSALARLDAWLCDVKESQIRDGLHILGTSPEGRLETDLLVALSRLPRRQGLAGDASLHRALAQDLDLAFDPLAAELGEPWQGLRPALLDRIDAAPWRTAGDTVERLEALAAAIVAGSAAPPGPASTAVMASIESRIRPAVRACGGREIAALLAGLAGRFVPAGPSGAPTPRSARCPPHRAQFLFARQPGGADPHRLRPWPPLRRGDARPPFPGPRPLPGGHGALRLGHLEHAHRRRRHRPGSGPDRRPAAMGAGNRPRHRLRDPAAGRARPPPRRRHLADLRLLPRCLSAADRAHRQGRPRHRRARRGAGRQSDRDSACRRIRPCWRNPGSPARMPGASPVIAFSGPCPAPTAPASRH